MPDALGWICIAIVAATLAAILTRPRGLSEATVAVLGAAAMVLAGPMRFLDVPDVIRETADVLLFLAGMMVLTAVVEQAGVFSVLAEGCARLARGSGVVLFCLVVLVGSTVTALLSLDVTVIVLTPIVADLTRRRRLDPLPFLFACTFIANTASLAFPISNLTNLLVVDRLQITFDDFAGTMWLPNLAAVVATMAVFLWIFRASLRGRYAPDERGPIPPIDGWLVAASVALLGTLAAIAILGTLGQPLAGGAIAGAAGLLAIGTVWRRITPAEVVRSVSWPVLAFVVGMLVVVRGLELGWLDSVTFSVPDSPTGALLLGAGAAAFGSNIINNVPMALLALPAIERTVGPARDAFAYGVLVGTNIGPTATTYGSLATMLWLAEVRRRGVEVSTREYLVIGFVSTPPILVATTAALWLVMR